MSHGVLLSCLAMGFVPWFIPAMLMGLTGMSRADAIGLVAGTIFTVWPFLWCVIGLVLSRWAAREEFKQ